MIKKLVLIVLLVASYCSGAELSMRESVRSHGPLVLLGDVAEIHARHSVETAELAQIDLFPAPAPGEKRTLRVREIQDILSLRGVNLTAHRFSGASQIVVNGPQRKSEPVRAAAASVERPATARPMDKGVVVTLVERALKSYIQAQAGEDGWNADVSLNDNQIESIQKLGANLSVQGGEAPWEGKQKFLISAEGSEGPATQVTAYLTSPPAIVVARHGLPKGVILRADDVKLQRGLSTKGESEVYLRIEDVVGKETTRVIAENQVLDSKLVRPQLLVRRNEIVTLYSRAEGVRVRTTARVRDDGAMGDLVTVESLQDRKPMFARVSGPQETEIFAQAVAASTPSQQATRSPERELQIPPMPSSVSALPHSGSRESK